MLDFLTFQSFIAPGVLLLAYYFGALAMPLLMWLGRNRLFRRFAWLGWVERQREQLFNQLSARQRRQVLAAMLLIFFVLEIIWRMMFEAMIGYFQMHDYLRVLSEAP